MAAAFATLPGCEPHPSFRNPVHDMDVADPFVLRVPGSDGDTLYAYATNGWRPGGWQNVPVLRSRDLVTWTDTGADALPDENLGEWVDQDRAGGMIWAPSVLPRTQLGGDYYVLYYTAPRTRRGRTRQCIGAAHAASPEGPFRDDRRRPLACQLELGGSIDPSPFLVPGGWSEPNPPAVLAWKSDQVALRDGSPTQLWARPLAADGLGFEDRQATLLLTSDPARYPWESGFGAGQIEGPSIVYQASTDRYLLVYSAGPWSSESYAVGYAWCDRYVDVPVGCTRPRVAASHPWIRARGGAHGPGGAEVFVDGEGWPWLTYHATGAPMAQAAFLAGPPAPRAMAVGNPRNLRLDRLCWGRTGKPRTDAPTVDPMARTRREPCAEEIP